jgi:hypothetical protein
MAVAGVKTGLAGQKSRADVPAMPRQPSRKVVPAWVGYTGLADDIAG